MVNQFAYVYKDAQERATDCCIEDMKRFFRVDQPKSFMYVASPDLFKKFLLATYSSSVIKDAATNLRDAWGKDPFREWVV